jgi:serine/threonine protein kinase
MTTPSVLYEVSTEPKYLRQYVVGHEIGEGCYGKVKEAVNVLTRERVAIKIMKRVVLKKIRGGEAAVQREIEILKLVQAHDRLLLHLVEHWFDADKAKTYLVTRLVDGESLAALLARVAPARLPPVQVQCYFRQVFKAVELLHKHSIAHRDLKPDNIMLAAHSHAVTLIDFGVALVVPHHDATAVASGSAAYQPPEKMTAPDHANDLDADVWATGLCLYQASTGVHPFEQCAPSAMFDRIAHADIDFSLVADHALLAAFHKLLAADPKQRCSARWARKHAFEPEPRSSSSRRARRKQFVAIGGVASAFLPDDIDRLEAQYRRDNNLSARKHSDTTARHDDDDDKNNGAGDDDHDAAAAAANDSDDSDDDLSPSATPRSLGASESDWQPPGGRHSVPTSPRQSNASATTAAAAATASAAALPPAPQRTSSRKKRGAGCELQ